MLYNVTVIFTMVLVYGAIIGPAVYWQIFREPDK